MPINFLFFIFFLPYDFSFFFAENNFFLHFCNEKLKRERQKFNFVYFFHFKFVRKILKWILNGVENLHDFFFSNPEPLQVYFKKYLPTIFFNIFIFLLYFSFIITYYFYIFLFIKPSFIFYLFFLRCNFYLNFIIAIKADILTAIYNRKKTIHDKKEW